MTLVDFRGFRIIAVALCPVDSDSLFYGSKDAGNTVLFNPKDPVTMEIEEVGKSLNLKKHQIPGGKSKISFPTDIGLFLSYQWIPNTSLRGTQWIRWKKILFGYGSHLSSRTTF